MSMRCPALRLSMKNVDVSFIDFVSRLQHEIRGEGSTQIGSRRERTALMAPSSVSISTLPTITNWGVYGF